MASFWVSKTRSGVIYQHCIHCINHERKLGWYVWIVQCPERYAKSVILPKPVPRLCRHYLKSLEQYYLVGISKPRYDLKTQQLLLNSLSLVIIRSSLLKEGMWYARSSNQKMKICSTFARSYVIQKDIMHCNASHISLLWLKNVWNKK